MSEPGTVATGFLSEPGAVATGFLSEPGAVATGFLSEPGAVATGSYVDHKIISAHVSCGGVAPIPLYLKETSEFLRGQMVNAATIADANEIMQAEISPISDVRGSAEYKRLLLRQLFRAHFVEMFDGPRH